MGVIIPRHDLRTTHEEPDVIIVQQVPTVAMQGIGNITVICDDTDVFILLLHFYLSKNLSCSILMEGTNSQQTVINISHTAKKHQTIVPHLLAAHAISGCDTTALMYGIGKATAINNTWERVFTV